MLKTPSNAHLLVILPALNEAAVIQEVIRRIPRQIEGVDRVDVLVVDDGSQDGTAQLARQAGADVISHSGNRGLGIAIQTGLREALRRGVHYAVNIDADGQFNPEEIRRLLQPLFQREADFATASRFKDPVLSPEMPRVKRWGNRGMSWLISRLTGQRFFDVSCGFRAYSRETTLRLVLHGQFTYTQETFLVLAHAGLRIAEVPLPVQGVRAHGRSRIASNLFRYAMQTLGIIFACLRDFRPGLFFNTVSALLLLIALGVGAFFLWHYLTTGAFTPHIWAGFVSGYLFGLSLMLFFVGQIALMLARQRRLQHEQLYHLRRLSLDRPHETDS